MIRSATETLPTFRPTRLACNFTAILTRVDATMNLLSAAHTAASIADMNDTIDVQRLERLGLFGRTD